MPLTFVSAAVIVGIGFSGLAVCLIVVCCGVVCLYRFIFQFLFASEDGQAIFERWIL